MELKIPVLRVWGWILKAQNSVKEWIIIAQDSAQWLSVAHLRVPYKAGNFLTK
jgi:hypothetical protein